MKMKRRLAALGCIAGIAFAQGADSPPAPPVHPLVIDAVALDASGHPVTDLTAKDFEVVRGGKAQRITRFTWFDTRLHTAASRAAEAEQLPALDLLPDEIRRNLVVVVDDLGLSAAGLQAVRTMLKAFVAGSMVPGDRMAIVCSSGGTGTLQQLTGDTRVLNDAIEGIRFLGGAISVASAEKASWLALRYTLEGVRHVPGRKAIVLLSENPDESGPSERATEAARAAHAAGAAVYAINPLTKEAQAQEARQGAVATLARDTGGSSGANFARVLQDEQGYYAIGFQPANTDANAPTAAAADSSPAVLQVRREGIVLRSRTGFLSERPRADDPLPSDRAELLIRGLTSPFAASDIRTRFTVRYSEERRGTPMAEAILYFDPRDVAMIHDLQDTYHGEVQLRVAAVGQDGRASASFSSSNAFSLRAADYRYALENGLRVAFQIKLPGPGAWQIRVLVADAGSDRVGSAVQFVDVPNLKLGGLALSGLTLSGISDPPIPREDQGMRIFTPGSSYVFSCAVLGELADMDKHSSLEVQTRIFNEG